MPIFIQHSAVTLKIFSQNRREFVTHTTPCNIMKIKFFGANLFHTNYIFEIEIPSPKSLLKRGTQTCSHKNRRTLFDVSGKFNELNSYFKSFSKRQNLF